MYCDNNSNNTQDNCYINETKNCSNFSDYMNSNNNSYNNSNSNSNCNNGFNFSGYLPIIIVIAIFILFFCNNNKNEC